MRAIAVGVRLRPEAMANRERAPAIAALRAAFLGCREVRHHQRRSHSIVIHGHLPQTRCRFWRSPIQPRSSPQGNLPPPRQRPRQ
jgi:hypothetical protein